MILLSLIAFTLIAFGVSEASLTDDEQRLLSEMDTGRMMHTIERLCCDQFGGRRAGSSEQLKAAEYLASQFEQCGLAAMDEPGIEGFTQPLTMRYSLVKSRDEIKATLQYKARGTAPTTHVLSYRDYNGRGGLKLESTVVFVGYGIYDPNSGYNDYADADVAGKIVMWLPGGPKGVDVGKAATGAKKLLAAYQHGAVACLIARPANASDQWGTNVGFSGSIADFPYMALSPSIAAEMFPGRTLPKGANSVDSGLSSLRKGTTGVELTLKITPVCDPERRTINVIGMIPGSDPEVAQEIVLVGAHYDHLGADSRGIFRGADDNASGTAAVLEVARSICHAGLTPRRTIVFAAWTGEEGGLVGSNFFTSNPPFPLDSVVSSIQPDMIGCGTPGKFVVTGAKAFPEHFESLRTASEELGITLDTDTLLGASDYLAFVRKGVPASLIYAAGEHPNYHSVRDVPAAIDRHVLEFGAKLIALSAWRAAN